MKYSNPVSKLLISVVRRVIIKQILILQIPVIKPLHLFHFIKQSYLWLAIGTYQTEENETRYYSIGLFRQF
jgi:hypothetical protein